MTEETEDIRYIRDYVIESNRIENIHRPPNKREIHAHVEFIARDRLDIPALEHFVGQVQPNAYLRSVAGMDVRVGPHVPVMGGPIVPFQLMGILAAVNADQIDPWTAHCRYETLHPFMDGNGRSGRAIWLWQTWRRNAGRPTLGFLHRFYYETLQHSEGR